VGVVASLLLMMLFALIWSLMFIFRRNFKSLKGSNSQELNNGGSPTRSYNKRFHANKKYTLLDAEEQDLHAQGTYYNIVFGILSFLCIMYRLFGSF